MYKILLFALIFAVSLNAVAGKAELQQTLKQRGVIQDLETAPDGVTIRLTSDGGFQIFAIGTGTYDFDDVDDVLDAQNEATLKAKANLAKFMNESLSTDEKIESMSRKVKSISSQNGETTASVNKTSAKTALTSIKNSSSALLKGVIVLSSAKIPAKGNSGTYRVMVGVSSKTLAAVGKLVNGITNAENSANPASGNISKEAPAVSSAQSPLPTGWIECIGYGSDRNSAVSAALTEGIQQIYGVSLQNDTKFRERVRKLKANTKALRISAKESENNTLTQTAGFIKEYKIIKAKDLGGGKYEAVVHAHIVNPRAGGVVAVMMYSPTMPLDKLAEVYNVGPNKRISGSELSLIVGKAFNRAFANANKFLVMDMEDLSKIIDQNKISKGLVDSGMSPGSELLKAGQLLTADYILTSIIEDLKYSRKLGMNKKTKKFGPVYQMSIRLSYKLTDVNNGKTVASSEISAKLDNDEVTALLSEDEETDLLLALMKKVTNILGSEIPGKNK